VALNAALGAAFVAHTDTMCYGDCVVEYAPKFASFARGVQTGSLPLADLHTFSGARQHYLSSIQLYYPPLYPLYWLADPDDLRQAAALLIVGPFALHLLWAALGAYAFARACVRLPPFAALASAVVYEFSSTLLTLDFLNQTSALSYLPWVTLAAAYVIRRASAKAWAAGALLVGAMNLASHANVPIRLWFIVGLQCILLAWLSRRSPASAVSGPGMLTRLLAVAALGVVGLGLAGYAWAGVYSGLTWISATENMSCPRAMDFAQGSSLSPVALLGLLFPYSYSQPGSSIVLGGGVVLAQTVGLALASVRSRSEVSREWLLIGIALVGFGIAVMLGKHTPVFGVLCAALPPFFGYPHPVSWGIVVSWGLAILSGIGAARIIANPSAIRQWVLLLISVAAAAGVAIGRPAIPTFRWDGPPVDALWYVAIVAAACAMAALLPRRIRGVALGVVLLAECLITPLSFVTSPSDAATPDPRDHSRWTLRNDGFRELRPVLREIAAERQTRFTGVNSYIDNQAWNANAHALLGYQPVALYPAFAAALDRFTEGRPYALWISWLPRFLANMNAGLLVSYRVTDDLPRLPWFDHWYQTIFARVLGPLPVVRQTEHFEIREIPSPLPYAYVQDRVEAAAPDEQLLQLVEGDLRRAAYIDVQASAEPPWWQLTSRAADGDFVAHFESLQRVNRVLNVDRSRPNRVRIDVDFGKPALLVIAESGMPGWHAAVGGQPAAIVGVNYLQQAVWLDEGARVVEMTFQPAAFVYGSTASVLAAGAIVFVLWRARSARRSRSTRRSSAEVFDLTA
jgi:hypothetical protein